MPFSETRSVKNWEDIYTQVIKRAVEESGFNYRCEKSKALNGSFTREIVENLRHAHLVVADLTDMNSNVLWELGIRHALSKRTIMIARKESIQDIPSDIKNYYVIGYEDGILNYGKFADEIKQALGKIETNPEKKDSPVFDFLSEEELIKSKITKNEISGKLAGLTTELLYNLALAEEIKAGKNAGVSPGKLTLLRFRTAAIIQYQITQYIEGTKEFRLTLENVGSRSHILNKRLELLSLETALTRKKLSQGQKIKKEIPTYMAKLKKCIKESISLTRSIQAGNVPDSKPHPMIFRDEHEEFFENKMDSSSKP